VAEKSFREDLYYRLNVVHIEVPALRDRREDIAVLVNHFLRGFSELHRMPLPELLPETMQHLTAYGWPGNVRELKNIAERLVLRCRTQEVTPDDLPAEIWRTRALDVSVESVPHTSAPATHDALYNQIVKGGESFWSAVYEPFMARDLTRRDVRELVRLGLENTRGNYKMLVSCFNMQPEDYKRFLNFLRKYQCHVPFQRFRMAPARLQERSAAVGGAQGAQRVIA
jgi:DNA-binding NtrC family response regulator